MKQPGDETPRTSSAIDRLIVRALPESNIAEGFRTVRANVSRAMEQGLKSILVVSTWPNDGKSMVCANMAVSFAQIRRKVLLVDGDLRRPTLTQLFEMRDRQGFATALESSAVTVDELATDIGQEGLRFLPSGPLPAHPSDLISGARARTVTQEMSRISECVILDSPPLSVCSDALVLAGLVDGVVLIINPRLWEGERELRAKEALEEAGARILGCVLNEVEERDSRYASYYYYRNEERPRDKKRWAFWKRDA